MKINYLWVLVFAALVIPSGYLSAEVLSRDSELHENYPRGYKSTFDAIGAKCKADDEKRRKTCQDAKRIQAMRIKRVLAKMANSKTEDKLKAVHNLLANQKLDFDSRFVMRTAHNATVTEGGPEHGRNAYNVQFSGGKWVNEMCDVGFDGLFTGEVSKVVKLIPERRVQFSKGKKGKNFVVTEKNFCVDKSRIAYHYGLACAKCKEGVAYWTGGALARGVSKCGVVPNTDIPVVCAGYSYEVMRKKNKGGTISYKEAKKLGLNIVDGKLTDSRWYEKGLFLGTFGKDVTVPDYRFAPVGLEPIYGGIQDILQFEENPGSVYGTVSGSVHKAEPGPGNAW